eukprot:COSAG04_NODE_863_length_9800_cov_12.998248_4_plen_97_part_00
MTQNEANCSELSRIPANSRQFWTEKLAFFDQVINDFVARSDGVLQQVRILQFVRILIRFNSILIRHICEQGSVTRIAGFSVAHDHIVVSVRGKLRR